MYIITVLVYCLLYCILFTFTFTFMHLADAFIQSDLHCIQVTGFFTFYQLLLSLGMFYAVLCMLMIEPLVYVISPIPCLVSLNSTSDDINESV